MFWQVQMRRQNTNPDSPQLKHQDSPSLRPANGHNAPRYLPAFWKQEWKVWIKGPRSGDRVQIYWRKFYFHVLKGTSTGYCFFNFEDAPLATIAPISYWLAPFSTTILDCYWFLNRGLVWNYKLFKACLSRYCWEVNQSFLQHSDMFYN
jgi:hypothetical protein